MADATITITSGAASATFTVPDATVQRLLPMIQEEYRPHHPGEDPTIMESFAAGMRERIKVDLVRYEKGNYVPIPPDMGGDPTST